jgi:hypothetical protein
MGFRRIVCVATWLCGLDARAGATLISRTADARLSFSSHSGDQGL